MGGGPLRVLAVASKPPFPPIGGGSLALHGLLRGLSEAGVSVRVVAQGTPPTTGRPSPYSVRHVARRPRSWARVLPSLLTRRPLAVARYRTAALERAVEEEMLRFTPDVVHLEQLHLAWLIPRTAGRSAVVLRQQNVESLLLARVASLLPVPLRWAARLESHRSARFEAAACASADLVAAITESDADVLRALAPRARVEVLPAPLAPEAHVAPLTLRGAPPFLCVGSFDWLPNRDGIRWLVGDVWPTLRRLAPHAVLHLAGPGSDTLGYEGDLSIERHGRVETAASLYDPRAVVLVPLRAGSGVRMRILEAWATGVPVVASAVAGEGLVTMDGDGALLASTAQEFASAAVRLAGEPELRRTIVERGRARVADHSCARVAERAQALYRRAIEIRCV
jgi:glycosyltransferase involved in cell wall biosynthesis